MVPFPSENSYWASRTSILKILMFFTFIKVIPTSKSILNSDLKLHQRWPVRISFLLSEKMFGFSKCSFSELSGSFPTGMVLWWSWESQVSISTSSSVCFRHVVREKQEKQLHTPGSLFASNNWSQQHPPPPRAGHMAIWVEFSIAHAQSPQTRVWTKFEANRPSNAISSPWPAFHLRSRTGIHGPRCARSNQ